MVPRTARHMYPADKTPAAKNFIDSVRRGVGFVVLGVTICFGNTQAQQVISQPSTQLRNMDGAEVYLVFCAGCHGFDGFAAYPPAPSFSLGERLHRSDDTLLQSVLKGKNGMPPWQDKLPWPMLRAPIDYLRTMNARRNAGLTPRTRPIPPIYFKFRPVGSTDPYLWYFTGQ